MVDATNRHKRKYFKDMISVLASLANVIDTYNPDSDWPPHVQTVIQHYQAQTLKSTMIPAPMSPGCPLRPSNPTLNRQFAPTSRLATLASSPGCASQIQRPDKASA